LGNIGIFAVGREGWVDDLLKKKSVGTKKRKIKAHALKI